MLSRGAAGCVDVDGAERIGAAVRAAGWHIRDGAGEVPVVARVLAWRSDGTVALPRDGIPVVVMDAAPSVRRAVDAIRSGAVDYLADGDVEGLAQALTRYARAGGEGGAVAVSVAARELFTLADRVAQTDVSVLIGGESGTGKEVVARFIHERSPRARGAFVAINCAAIPEHMLEAVLFGHERGAFTGAHQSKPGKFEQADGGTLLLDEISEMALGLQAKILRVLQEREVERLGGGQTMPVDVRVIATSNRDLKDALAAGEFREDLFYRLSVFPLVLAPLRERPDDIEPLARHFLDKYRRTPVSLDASALAALRAHPWPGNVRELENTIQRALVLASDGVIGRDDLCLSEDLVRGADSLSERLKDEESDLIVAALKAHNGRRRDTAHSLGISERTLRYKLNRMKAAGVALTG